MVYTRTHARTHPHVQCVYLTYQHRTSVLAKRLFSFLCVYSHTHAKIHAYTQTATIAISLLCCYLILLCVVLCCSFRSSFLSTDFYYIRTYAYTYLFLISVWYLFIYFKFSLFFGIFQHNSLPLLFFCRSISIFIVQCGFVFCVFHETTTRESKQNRIYTQTKDKTSPPPSWKRNCTQLQTYKVYTNRVTKQKKK